MAHPAVANFAVGQWIIAHESTLRIFCYVTILLTMLALEHAVSAKPVLSSKLKRWLNNLSLSWLSGLLVRMTIPLLATGTAIWAQKNQIGLLNQFETPAWASVSATILLMDFAIYWQHRMFHAVPILWRLHAVHHTDPEVDASTAGRFHPLEIGLSMLLKMGMVLTLGAPVLAVILFEILLNGSAIFNHSNIRLHGGLERFFRYWLVTPSVHRFHHSVIRLETDSNFGFFLIFWDKLFRTFIDKTQSDEHGLKLGLPSTEALDTRSLSGLLLMPLRYPKASGSTTIDPTQPNAQG